MTTSTIVPGAIVKISPPWKPSEPELSIMHNVESGEMMFGMEYPYWGGFTFGIVTSVEDKGKVIFAHLYDPEYACLYCDQTAIPIRVQLSQDEVTFVEGPQGVKVIAREKL